MGPAPQVEYASPQAQARRPLTGVRVALIVVGLLWFGFMAFLAVGFFVFRGLADDPSSRMTASRALRVCARLIGIGLPGIALVVAALRFRR